MLWVVFGFSVLVSVDRGVAVRVVSESRNGGALDSIFLP